MSILIKGMEMPHVEMELSILLGADGKWYAVDTNAETTDGEWHELVPVPSHGRLIDADALLFAIPAPIEDEYKHVRLVIKGTPTIIPAEEDNKNEI